MQSQSFPFQQELDEVYASATCITKKKSENVVLFCLFRSMREAAKGGKPFTQWMTSTGTAIKDLLVTNTAQ